MPLLLNRLFIQHYIALPIRLLLFLGGYSLQPQGPSAFRICCSKGSRTLSAEALRCQICAQGPIAVLRGFASAEDQ